MKRIVALLFYAVSIYSYGQMPNFLNKAEKVNGLAKFYQEVNYNFIYLADINRLVWDYNFYKLIDEVQETENDWEYFYLLQKYCATLKDGHTSIYMPGSLRQYTSRNNFEDCRIFVQNVDHKIIVSRVSENIKKEIPVGSEIIRVNGESTHNYLAKQVYPYISASTPHGLRNGAANSFFYGPIGKKYELTFKLPGGKIHTKNVVLSQYQEMSMYPEEKERELFQFEWIDKEIAYIALNGFHDLKIIELFAEKLPEIKKAKKLIIDLRENGGGDTDIGKEILNYLTPDSLLYGARSFTRELNSAHKAWGLYINTMEGLENNTWGQKDYLNRNDSYYYSFPYSPTPTDPQKERIVIPSVLLIGNHTFSAAEDFLIFADNQEHMIKIGQPTAGSTGQPILFNLVGGAQARVCAKKDTYHDGRLFVGIGILPDIPVNYTVEDYIQQRDPGLEKAIEYLKGIKTIEQVAAHPRISKGTGDDKINPKWINASSYQLYNGPEKMMDYSKKSIYHSNWNNKEENYFPIHLDFFFENADKIDYIIYYPREDDSKNGYFKQTEIWVQQEGQDSFTKVMDFDFKGKSDPTKVTLKPSVQKPRAIRFVIKSGTGDGQGFASCSEMEFYSVKK
ncbi:MAG: discoidin domain-containing protein [Bacteroidales bacterium]|nr:discoidin domain-containing protein [Bacteroidales bacterium]